MTFNVNNYGISSYDYSNEKTAGNVSDLYNLFADKYLGIVNNAVSDFYYDAVSNKFITKTDGRWNSGAYIADPNDNDLYVDVDHNKSIRMSELLQVKQYKDANGNIYDVDLTLSGYTLTGETGPFESLAQLNAKIAEKGLVPIWQLTKGGLSILAFETLATAWTNNI